MNSESDGKQSDRKTSNPFIRDVWSRRNRQGKTREEDLVFSYFKNPVLLRFAFFPIPGDGCLP